MSYCGGGAGLFFFNSIKPHADCDSFSAKAAGSFAITSPMLRLHVGRGSPGNRDEAVETQRQCDGGEDRPGRPEDQPGSI